MDFNISASDIEKKRLERVGLGIVLEGEGGVGEIGGEGGGGVWGGGGSYVKRKKRAHQLTKVKFWADGAAIRECLTLRWEVPQVTINMMASYIMPMCLVSTV